ncbi:hypothetical protein BH20GEM3_BH20GEM3_10620 [soil metagenome]
MPALSPAEEEKLRRAFSKLSRGQDIWIRYAPAAGTRIICGGDVVVATRDHQLMSAVLDLWLDSTPVSEEVRETLVAELGGRQH